MGWHPIQRCRPDHRLQKQFPAITQVQADYRFVQSQIKTCLKRISTRLRTLKPKEPHHNIIWSLQGRVPETQIEIQEGVISIETVDIKAPTTVSQREQFQDGDNATKTQDWGTGKDHRAKERESQPTADNYQWDTQTGPWYRVPERVEQKPIIEDNATYRHYLATAKVILAS